MMMELLCLAAVGAFNSTNGTNATSGISGGANSGPLERMCCQPHPDLQYTPAGGGAPEGGATAQSQPQPRAAWVRKHCRCLVDNATVSGIELQPLEYAHFHWALTDPSAVDDAAGTFVTFWLTPCYGLPRLFVKPLVLREGRALDQLFETHAAPAGRRGGQTETWPFPDASTGSTAQPLDYRVSGAAAADARAIAADTWNASGSSWGIGSNITQLGFETAITVRLRHVGYVLSVQAMPSPAFSSEGTASFSLRATLHSGANPRNPAQRAHEAAGLARRSTLKARWDTGGLGKLTLEFDASSFPRDTYQVFMMRKDLEKVASAAEKEGLESAAEKAEREAAARQLSKGTCAFELEDLPGGLSSSCIVWSPCGLRRNAIPVGDPLGPADIDPSGVHQLRLESFGLKLPRGIPHLFSVLRTPHAGVLSDPTTPHLERDEEVYIAIVATRAPVAYSLVDWEAFWLVAHSIFGVMGLLFLMLGFLTWSKIAKLKSLFAHHPIEIINFAAHVIFPVPSYKMLMRNPDDEVREDETFHPAGSDEEDLVDDLLEAHAAGGARKLRKKKKKARKAKHVFDNGLAMLKTSAALPKKLRHKARLHKSCFQRFVLRCECCRKHVGGGTRGSRIKEPQEKLLDPVVMDPTGLPAFDAVFADAQRKIGELVTLSNRLTRATVHCREQGSAIAGGPAVVVDSVCNVRVLAGDGTMSTMAPVKVSDCAVEFQASFLMVHGTQQRLSKLLDRCDGFSLTADESGSFITIDGAAALDPAALARISHPKERALFETNAARVRHAIALAHDLNNAMQNAREQAYISFPVGVALANLVAHITKLGPGASCSVSTKNVITFSEPRSTFRLPEQLIPLMSAARDLSAVTKDIYERMPALKADLAAMAEQCDNLVPDAEGAAASALYAAKEAGLAGSARKTAKKATVANIEKCMETQEEITTDLMKRFRDVANNVKVMCRSHACLLPRAYSTRIANTTPTCPRVRAFSQRVHASLPRMTMTSCTRWPSRTRKVSGSSARTRPCSRQAASGASFNLLYGTCRATSGSWLGLQ